MFLRWSLVAALLAVLAACTSAPATQTTPTPDANSQKNETPIASTPTQTPTATLTPTVTTTSTPSATPQPVDLGPTNFPVNVNPLSGFVVSDPSLLERRPLAVKIQLFPRGQRPPWGLSQADIVFDYYQNDGLTRLYAIFYSRDAEVVGPIRSARLLDNRLTRMYRSNFAFGGADQRILNVILNAEYYDRLILQGPNSPMWREEPNGPNYLLTSTVKMTEFINAKGIDNGRQNLDGMMFQLAPPAGGLPGEQVTVRYSISSYTRWEYDPATGLYLRYQDTQEDTGSGEAYALLKDRTNDQPITAANVVVIFVTHDDYLRNGRYNIVDILLDYSGLAYLFRDGQAYQVGWLRPTLESVLSLVDSSGAPFPFKHGNTWFQVVGQNSLIPQRGEAGAWRFESRIP